MPAAHPGRLSLVARGANAQTCIEVWAICPGTVWGCVFGDQSTHWDTMLIANQFVFLQVRATLIIISYQTFHTP